MNSIMEIEPDKIYQINSNYAKYHIIIFDKMYIFINGSGFGSTIIILLSKHQFDCSCTNCLINKTIRDICGHYHLSLSQIEDYNHSSDSIFSSEIQDYADKKMGYNVLPGIIPS